MIELRKEGKTYQYIQCPLKCPANMVHNAINYDPKRYGKPQLYRTYAKCASARLILLHPVGLKKRIWAWESVMALFSEVDEIWMLEVHERSLYLVKDTPKIGWSLPNATWTSHFQKVDLSFGQMSLSWCFLVEQVQNSIFVEQRVPHKPYAQNC